MNIAGVVLAGGQSSRMGRTKALVEIDGLAMASWVIGALRDAGCDPVVICGGDADELADLDAPVQPDRYPGAGPLGGLISAIESLDDLHDGVLVVPCDVPDLDRTILTPLLLAADRSLAEHDVVVARTDRLEPLCAVWARRSGPAVEAFFDGGGRAVHRLIRELDVVEVDVPRDALRNVNTAADVD